jgi:hypothetical protein
MRRTCLAILFAAAPVLGCGDESPTAPSRTPTTISRVWAGTLSDDLNGAGTLRVEGSGAGPALLGTWTAQFPASTKSGQALINLSPLPTTGGFAFILNPTARPTCSDPLFGPLAGSFLLQLTGTENALSGTAIYYDCTRVYPGRVELTRQ